MVCTVLWKKKNHIGWVSNLIPCVWRGAFIKVLAGLSRTWSHSPFLCRAHECKMWCPWKTHKNRRNAVKRQYFAGPYSEVSVLILQMYFACEGEINSFTWLILPSAVALLPSVRVCGIVLILMLAPRCFQCEGGEGESGVILGEGKQDTLYKPVLVIARHRAEVSL